MAAQHYASHHCRYCRFLTVAIRYLSASLSSIRLPIDPLLSQNAMRFYNRIAIDRTYNGLALDHAEGERIAHAMNGADVVFLANHGPIVCGESVAYAYDDLYYLERAARVEVLAHASGLPLTPVDEHKAAVAAEQIQQERLQSTLFFESLRRLL